MSDGENNYFYKEYLNKSIEKKSRENISSDITLENLKEQFKKFNGNYIDYIEEFYKMSESDKKFFILYSIFYFNVKFRVLDTESIVSNDLFQELAKFSNKTNNYENGQENFLECSQRMSGPILKIINYTNSTQLRSNNIFKNIDLLSVEQLAKFYKSGCRYIDSFIDEEKKIYESHDVRLKIELSIFNRIIDSLTNKKINIKKIK